MKGTEGVSAWKKLLVVAGRVFAALRLWSGVWSAALAHSAGDLVIVWIMLDQLHALEADR